MQIYTFAFDNSIQNLVTYYIDVFKQMHFILEIFSEKYAGMLKNLSCLSLQALINLLANSIIYEVNATKNEKSNGNRKQLISIDEEQLKMQCQSIV